MLGKAVASGCLNAKSNVRRVKQLPLVAFRCRSAVRVRAPSSPPFIRFIFYHLAFPLAVRVNMLEIPAVEIPSTPPGFDAAQKAGRDAMPGANVGLQGASWPIKVMDQFRAKEYG